MGNIATRSEKLTARDGGMGVMHYRVLVALKHHPDGLTYRGVEKATGYYSLLTRILRKSSRWGSGINHHPDSLGTNGYVSEKWVDNTGSGSRTIIFRITEEGKEQLQEVQRRHIAKCAVRERKRRNTRPYTKQAPGIAKIKAQAALVLKQMQKKPVDEEEE